MVSVIAGMIYCYSLGGNCTVRTGLLKMREVCFPTENVGLSPQSAPKWNLIILHTLHPPTPLKFTWCNKFSKAMLSLKGRVAFTVHNTFHLTVYYLAVWLVGTFSGTKILHPQIVGNPFTFPIALPLKGAINLLGEQGKDTSLQLSPYYFFYLAFFGIQPL